jgi:hypothetical protein
MADELRRHVYRRDKVPVRIKLKYKHKETDKLAWANWYRVCDQDGVFGWQAAKPAGYREVPYVTFGTDPFHPEVAADALIWPEGEKDVDTITRMGGLAFTFGGTGDGLPANAAEYLGQRDVVILADNDQGGRDHAQNKAALAHTVAKSVKVVEFSELPERSDVSDWFVQGHSHEEFYARVDKAPLWSPPSSGTSSNARSKTETKRRRQLILGCLSEVKPERVRWLWPSRIPRKFILFTGPPDVGKTLSVIDLAARLTAQKDWPDGSGRAPSGSVIYLSAEDGIADTIRPRAEAAGADLSRIHYLKSVVDENGDRSTFNLQADLVQLEAFLTTHRDVSLVIIDPLTAYLGAGKIDTHKTADVRAILSPLTEFADKHAVAVIGLTHPPKNAGRNAMNAATGSLAFIAAARGAYLFTREFDQGHETGRTLMLSIKNNLGPQKDGLAFRIADRKINEEITAPCIEWDNDPVSVTADEALAAAELERASDHSALNDAVEFLRTELCSGEVETTVIEEQARRAGIAKRTLARARKKLQVKTRREGFGRDGKFFLSLP